MCYAAYAARITVTDTATAYVTAGASPTATSSSASSQPSVPSICSLKDDAMKLGMSSWWHCDGPSSACYARVLKDMQRNLDSKGCANKDCYAPMVPTNIEVLRKLGERFWPVSKDEAGTSPNSTSTAFTPYMELLANVAVQKSRFCRIDFDIVALLAELVAASQPCCGCSLASNSTQTASSSGAQEGMQVNYSATTIVSTFSTAYTRTG